MKKALKLLGAAAVTAVLLFSFVGCDMFTDSEVAVSSITLDNYVESLAVDGTATVTATVSPSDADDKTVTWVSSDESVATVADGVISAVASGDAQITATAGGKSATIYVHAGSDDIEILGTWHSSYSEKWVITNNSIGSYYPTTSTDPNYSFTIEFYSNDGFNAGDTESSDSGFALVKYSTAPSYNEDATGYVVYRWKELTTDNGDTLVDIAEGYNSSYSDGAPTIAEALENYSNSTSSYSYSTSCVKQ